MMLEAYLDKFSNRRNVVEQCSGCASTHPGLIKNTLRDAGLNPDNPDNYSSDEFEEAQQDAKETHLAFVFLSNANKAKFAPCLRELNNSYLYSNNKYPCTVAEAHKLLVGWGGRSYILPCPSNDGIVYTTIREEEEDQEELSDEDANVLVTTGTNKRKVLRDKRGNVLECFICGGNHYSNTYNQ
eukprot:3090231-Ditylum_brightwellii.AAC.1